MNTPASPPQVNERILLYPKEKYIRLEKFSIWKQSENYC